MDILAWLEQLGLGQYGRVFAENDIDVSVLGQLTDSDLKELGVSSLGHRKRLLAAIAAEQARNQLAVGPAEPPPGDERRQVTILFADLCGYSTLAQSLDPEELQGLLRRYTTVVDELVIAYGGRVDKHIGDAVMALFGAPLAHDDDPLRAVRAGLDIHDALARTSETLVRPLRAHIGIACGEVVAGVLSRANPDDYTVLGESVNLAARLVAAAGPGQTLISDEVYRTTSARVLCDPAGEMDLKGIGRPVRVWLLRGLRPEPLAAARSSFVGREAELQQFSGIVAACKRRGRGHVVYLRGEAGIGKTRLLEELRAMTEVEGFVTHRALVLDFGVGKEQDPVGAIVRSLLRLGPHAGQAERLAAAARVVSADTVAPELQVFLQDLLGLPQDGQWRSLYDAMNNPERNRGKRAVLAAIAAEACRREPAMFIVEDLHWADPELLGHLAVLVSALAQVPAVLALTSRVEGDPLDPPWRASCRGTPFTTFDLGPLQPQEAIKLAATFIDATQRVATACIDRAGGNPLFLEQLLHNAQEGTEDAVPASIQSLVLARIDRLPPRDRQAFQAASVIGQRFELPLLRRIIGVADYGCDQLIRNGLVLPEGDGFLFAHALIQEGTYASLVKTRRRDLHLIAAEWFAGNDPMLYAQHLDRAQDERAPQAYLAAARAQRAAYHLEAAARLVERGLQIASTSPQRYELMCLHGDLHQDLGNIPASVATYREAVSIAPDDVSRCRAQVGLAEALRVSEGLGEALDLLQPAQVVAEQGQLTAELAKISPCARQHLLSDGQDRELPGRA